MTMPTPQPILDGLHGLRLALYDEALAAGPCGLSCAELRARTAEDRERLGCTPSAERAAWAWLAAQGLLREYQPDRWRGIALAEARPVSGDRAPVTSDRLTVAGEQSPVDSHRRPETGDRNTAPAVAQLRTPAVEMKTRKGGQLAFF